MSFFAKFKAWNRQRIALRDGRFKLRTTQDLTHIRTMTDAAALAAADPNGLGMAKLRMTILHCLEKYEYILCAVPPGALVIDGGANLGLFSDLMLGLGAKVQAFEPNPILCNHLRRKYRLSDNHTQSYELIQKAISDTQAQLTFSMTKNGAFIAATQGGSLDVDPGANRLDFDVEAIDFAEHLKNLQSQGIRPYLIKLDIEGSEFEVLNKLLDENLCGAFDYLVCETHERFFANGEERMRKLKTRLQEKGITNILLDWA